MDGFPAEFNWAGGDKMLIREFTYGPGGVLKSGYMFKGKEVELSMGPFDRSTWVEVPLIKGRTVSETWDAFKATAAKHDGVHDYQYNASDRDIGKFNSNSAWRSLLEENGYDHRKFDPKGGGFKPGVRKRLPQQRTPEPDDTEPTPPMQGGRRPGRTGNLSPQPGDDRFSFADTPTDTVEDRSPIARPEAQSKDLPEGLPLALSERFDDSGSRFEAALRLGADGNLEAPAEGDALIELISKHAVPLTKPDMSGVFFALPLFDANGVFVEFETIRNAKGDQMEVDFLEATNRRRDGPFSAAVRAVAEGASSAQPAKEMQTVEATQPEEQTVAAGPAQPSMQTRPDQPTRPNDPTQPAGRERV